MAALIAASARLLAHDLWIEPSAFVVTADQPLAVRLKVGMDLLGDPVARETALIDRFVAVNAGESMPVPGVEGVDPAGAVRVATTGLLIVGYASKPARIVLPARKFNEYLAEEGLETIAALRARRNQTDVDAREEFSRCAKALVASGAPASTNADRALGFTLELIAERNPYTLHAGGELPVRLLFKGRPLRDALVMALNKRDASAKLSGRTDAGGRVKFRLAQPGMWLIKAVHMIEAPAGGDAQWSSFWASLTFQMPNASAPGATAR